MSNKYRGVEEWRKVAGYPAYEISNYGRVKSAMQHRWKSGGMRKLTPDRKGYVRCAMIRDDGKNVTRYVHRMVAEAFIENAGGLEEVEHRDGHPQNNCATNLEWIGHRENIFAAVRRRGVHWCRGHGNAAVEVGITRVDVENGEAVRYGSIRAAVDGLNAQTVAAGGDAGSYMGMAGNIVHARDKARLSYGYVWAGGEVEDVGAYLAKLRPANRSPLAGVLRKCLDRDRH